MKHLFFIIIIILSFTLYGCVSDPNTYYFDSSILITDTLEIELVFYQNDSPKMITVSDNKFPSFIYENSTSLEMLDTSLLDSFILELSTITFHDQNESANSPVGNTLVLHQSNGDMLIISCSLIEGIAYSFVSRFDSNNNYIEHIASFADRPKFKRLLMKYFYTI